MHPLNNDLPPTVRELENGNFLMPEFGVLHEVEIQHPVTDTKGNPVLDEYGKPKVQIINFDKDRLEKVAQRINERAQNQAPSAVIFGHTSENLPEDSQPPVIGYLVKARVGYLTKADGTPVLNKKTGRPKSAVFAVPMGLPGTIQKFRDGARTRSVEIFCEPEGDDPDSVALLSSTAARCPDLQVHQFARKLFDSHHKITRFNRVGIRCQAEVSEDEEMPEGNNAPRADAGGGDISDAACEKIITKLMQTEPMRRLMAALPVLEEIQQEEGGAGNPSTPTPPGAPDEGHTGKPEQMAACAPGTSTSSMTNVNLPGQTKARPPYAPQQRMASYTPAPGSFSHATIPSETHSPMIPDITGPSHMNRGRRPTQFAEPAMTAQDRAALVGTQQELQQVKLQLQKVQAEATAGKLALLLKGVADDPNGPIFDANYEIDKMARMPEAQWSGHIQFMRTNYKSKADRPPNGGQMPIPEEQQIDPATLAKIHFQRPPVPGMRVQPAQPQGEQIAQSNDDAESIGREVAKRRARGEHDCSPAKVMMERRAGGNGAVKVR